MSAREHVAIAFCTYHPPVGFSKKLEQWVGNVGGIIVVEDGPNAIDHLPNMVKFLNKSTNLGIADSVNRALEQTAGFDWIVLFDQDTEIEVSYIDSLLQGLATLAADGCSVAALGAGKVGELTYAPSSSGHRYVEVDEVIQSATIFNVRALKEIGGADNSLVIDGVDTDICLKLKRAGYWVGIDQDLRIEHPIGSGRTIRFFGRSIMLSEHAPFRRYYMTRNRIEMLKRHGVKNVRWSIIYLRRMMVSTLLSITVERARMQNFKAIVRGTFDGLRGRLGKRDFS